MFDFAQLNIGDEFIIRPHDESTIGLNANSVDFASSRVVQATRELVKPTLQSIYWAALPLVADDEIVESGRVAFSSLSN